ncbi:MAG: hypothetical protein ACRDKW_03830 [Actinomycetota bacterium]
MTYVVDAIACLPRASRTGPGPDVEVVVATDLGPGFDLRILLSPERAADLTRRLAGIVGSRGDVGVPRAATSNWVPVFGHFGW